MGELTWLILLFGAHPHLPATDFRMCLRSLILSLTTTPSSFGLSLSRVLLTFASQSQPLSFGLALAQIMLIWTRPIPQPFASTHTSSVRSGSAYLVLAWYSP